MCVSLEMAVASVGGFCAGKSYVIDHQRLSGLGYCFSASVPPMLASAAMESLTVMQSNTNIFEKVRENAKLMREKLKGYNTFILITCVGNKLMLVCSITVCIDVLASK